MSSKRNRQRRNNGGQSIATPLPQATSEVRKPGLINYKDRTIQRLMLAAAVAVAIVSWLAYTNTAHAEEAVVPEAPTDLVVVEETEAPAERGFGSRVKSGLKFIWSGEPDAIVSDAETDYAERVAALDAREAQLVELNNMLRDDEERVNQEAERLEVELNEVNSKVKALTLCVAKAMEDPA